jgi:hypothetical protein
MHQDADAGCGRKKFLGINVPVNVQIEMDLRKKIVNEGTPVLNCGQMVAHCSPTNLIQEEKS